MEMIKIICFGLFIIIAILDVSIIVTSNDVNRKIDELSLEYFCKGEKSYDEVND